MSRLIIITVAKEAKGENAGWTVKLIIFVGGTCGSVHVQTFNNNMRELGVVESKRKVEEECEGLGMATRAFNGR